MGSKNFLVVESMMRSLWRELMKLVISRCSRGIGLLLFIVGW